MGPNIWRMLENASWEKCISAIVGWNILYMSVRSSWFIVLFKVQYFLIYLLSRYLFHWTPYVSSSGIPWTNQNTNRILWEQVVLCPLYEWRTMIPYCEHGLLSSKLLLRWDAESKDKEKCCPGLLLFVSCLLCSAFTSLLLPLSIFQNSEKGDWQFSLIFSLFLWKNESLELPTLPLSLTSLPTLPPLKFWKWQLVYPHQMSSFFWRIGKCVNTEPIIPHINNCLWVVVAQFRQDIHSFSLHFPASP